MDTDKALDLKSRRLRIPLRWIGTKDKFPSPPWKKGGYIINLEDDHKSDGTINSGTHWTAMHVGDDGVVYSDSFGFPPPSDIDMKFGKHKYIFTNRQVQDETTGHCGEYALYFLYQMSKPRGNMRIKDKVQSFLDLFSHDTRQNLKRLKHYLDAAYRHVDHAHHEAVQE